MVCTLYFSARGKGTRSNRREEMKKWRDRGDNNVRSERVKGTCASYTRYRDFLLVTRASTRASSLLSTLPFIPRHTRYTVRTPVRTTPGDLQSRG